VISPPLNHYFDGEIASGCPCSSPFVRGLRGRVRVPQDNSPLCLPNSGAGQRSCQTLSFGYDGWSPFCEWQACNVCPLAVISPLRAVVCKRGYGQSNATPRAARCFGRSPGMPPLSLARCCKLFGSQRILVAGYYRAGILRNGLQRAVSRASAVAIFQSTLSVCDCIKD